MSGFYGVLVCNSGSVFGFIKDYYWSGVEDIISKIEGVDLARRTFVVASLVMIILAFVAGFSVVGLLQSTERVSSSGIIVQPAPPPPLPPPSSPPSPPPSPPPEPTIDIDVYSDSACTQVKSSVVWGEIEAGSSTSEVLYIKNAGDSGVILSLATDNWDPLGAADDIHLSWDYENSTLGPGAVLEVTLTLSVDSSSSGIDVFSFDIIIIGSEL